MNKDSCGIDSIFLKWILAVGMFPPPPISVYHQLQTGPSVIFQALKPSTAFSWNTNMSKSFRPWLSAHSNVGNLHCRNTGIQQVIFFTVTNTHLESSWVLFSYLTGSVSVQHFILDDKPEPLPLSLIGLHSVQITAHGWAICVCRDLQNDCICVSEEM